MDSLESWISVRYSKLWIVERLLFFSSPIPHWTVASKPENNYEIIKLKKLSSRSFHESIYISAFKAKQPFHQWFCLFAWGVPDYN